VSWLPSSSRLRRIGQGALPLAVSWLPIVPFLAIHAAVRSADSRPGGWILLLVLPFLAVETAFSHWYERAAALTRLRRVTYVFGLLARLATIGAVFALLVVRTASVHGTPDPFDSLLADWPDVMGLFLRSTPWIGALGVSAAAAVYLGLTVRRRRLRLTATWLLPVVVAYGQFELSYNYPDSPLRGGPQPLDPSVERVLPRDRGGQVERLMGETLYPRAVEVAPDDSFLVATFGSTFGHGTVVGFSRQNRLDDQPNLLWLDLATRHGGVHRSTTIRDFRSNCPERVFVAPWGKPQLLELDVHRGVVTEHPLPDQMAGRPLRENNSTTFDCRTGRVYVVSSLNTGLVVWDASEGRVTRTISFVEEGISRMGDHAVPLVVNHRLGRIFVGLQGRRHLVELDERDLGVLRTVVVPRTPYALVGSADDRALFVAAWYRGVIYRYDPATLEVTHRMDAPPHCRGLQTSPDGRVLYATSFFTGELLAYEADTGRELGRWSVGPKAEGLSVTDSYVYVSTARGVVRLRRTPGLTSPGSPGG